MVAIHKMISISPEQDKFIKDNDINVSRVVQDHIDDVMFNRNHDEQGIKNLIQSLNAKIEHWKKLDDDAMDFIKEKGFLNEFLAKKGYEYNGN